MQYGWAAPIIPVLQQPDSPIEIQQSQVVWIEALYMIGGLIGLPVTIICVDKLGRKYSILLASCNTLIAWILIATANNVIQLYVARILTGLAGDVAFVSAPMYIAEIADQNIRGFLGSCIYIMMLVGILVIYSVAPFVSVPISSAVGACVILLQLCTFPWMPESPYYLLIKKKPEKARAALKWLRNGQDIEKEFQEIQSAVERQDSEKGRIVDLFKVKSNLKGITIMSVLNASQHFSGISVMLMNLHTILADAGAILTPGTAGIVFAVLMLCSSSIAGVIVDKTGRKSLLACSSILTGLSLAVLATYFAIKNSGADVALYNWVPVAAVMVYAVAFKFGLGIVPIVLTAELFPTSIKAMGMTIADAMYVLFATISIYLYDALAEHYGLHAPFFLFATSCILTALYVIFFIPETKGKTLEEIQYILKGQKFEMKSSPTHGEMERSRSPVSETSVVVGDRESMISEEGSSAESDTPANLAKRT